MNKTNSARVAFITGGATGLGQAFAQRLARDGVDVVIADVNDATETVRLVEKQGRRGLAIRCDVTDEEQVSRAATAAEDAFGQVDILVSNAGIYPNATLDSLSLADWRRVFAVNVDGAFLVTRALLPAMQRRGWGRVIFLASASFHPVSRTTSLPRALSSDLCMPSLQRRVETESP